MITHNAPSQPNEGIEPEMVTFLETIADSFIKWDLIRFFNDNPHAVDPAETVARFISRDLQDVETQLDALVDAGVLNIRLVSRVKAYGLTNDATMRDRIARFLQACDDKIFRLKAIRYVIHLATLRLG